MRHETRDEKALQNSIIFGILNKKWSNLKKMLFIFFAGMRMFEISSYI